MGHLRVLLLWHYVWLVMSQTVRSRDNTAKHEYEHFQGNIENVNSNSLANLHGSLSSHITGMYTG
jgi:hypothetical protein